MSVSTFYNNKHIIAYYNVILNRMILNRAPMILTTPTMLNVVVARELSTNTYQFINHVPKLQNKIIVRNHLTQRHKPEYLFDLQY